MLSSTAAETQSLSADPVDPGLWNCVLAWIALNYPWFQGLYPAVTVSDEKLWPSNSMVQFSVSKDKWTMDAMVKIPLVHLGTLLLLRHSNKLPKSRKGHVHVSRRKWIPDQLSYELLLKWNPKRSTSRGPANYPGPEYGRCQNPPPTARSPGQVEKSRSRHEKRLQKNGHVKRFLISLDIS